MNDPFIDRTNGTLLSTESVTRSFGALRASDAVSLEVVHGEIHALIGPNGAGKSTLVALIAGSLPLDSGRVRLLGEDVTSLGTVERARRGLGRSFQVSAVVPGFTVIENVMLALLGRERHAFSIWRAWRRHGALLAEAREHADRVALGQRLSVVAEELAHGERRRLELAMALALKPKVFLLDEPLAGMGAEGAAGMIELLATLKRDAPILLIEHDMDAVFALADRVSVLVNGRVIASGTVDEVRTDPQVRTAYLGEADSDERQSPDERPDGRPDERMETRTTRARPDERAETRATRSRRASVPDEPNGRERDA